MTYQEQLQAFGPSDRTKTHGRCDKCNHVVRWKGWPPISRAFCPACGSGLRRTAIASGQPNHGVPYLDTRPIGRDAITVLADNAAAAEKESLDAAVKEARRRADELGETVTVWVRGPSIYLRTADLNDPTPLSRSATKYAILVPAALRPAGAR